MLDFVAKCIDLRKLAMALTMWVLAFVALAPSAYVFLAEFSPASYMSIMDSRQLWIFARTILLGASVAILSTILGLVVAFLLECTDLPLRSWFGMLSVIPLLLPPYISTIAWMALLGKRGDWFNISFPFGIYNIQSAVIFMSLSYFPLISLIVSYALRNVDFRLEEAGRQVYPTLTVFRRITLSLISPHIVIGSLFVFILSVSEYGVPSLLQVHVYMTEIFAEFSAFFNMGNAVALSLPLLVLIFAVITVIHIYFRGKSYVTISSFSRRRSVIALSTQMKAFGVAFMLVLLAFSAFIPLAILLFMSRGKFMEAFLSASDSFVNSFWLACVSAVLLAACGFFVAYFFRRLSDPFVFAPLAIPSAIMALGLIKIWNHPYTSFIYGTPAIILLGYLGRFIPFVAKVFSPFFEQISNSFEEAARLSDASFPSILRKILLPLMRPAMVPALIVGFVLSLRELEVTLLVTPPGFQTLPNRIYTLLHYGDFELVSALCIMVVALIIIPPAVILSLQNILTWATSNSRT
jgi:iron(III) transport system permease protein